MYPIKRRPVPVGSFRWAHTLSTSILTDYNTQEMRKWRPEIHALAQLQNHQVRHSNNGYVNSGGDFDLNLFVHTLSLPKRKLWSTAGRQYDKYHFHLISLNRRLCNVMIILLLTFLNENLSTFNFNFSYIDIQCTFYPISLCYNQNMSLIFSTSNFLNMFTSSCTRLKVKPNPNDHGRPCREIVSYKIFARRKICN